VLVNSSASTTYAMVNRSGFDITYLDGRNIQGDYISDTVQIDNHSIKSQQLGLARDTVRGTGLMGLGFTENVASPTKYPTILDNMFTQGLISRRAFSLYLNDLQASTGTVLFGGIDTEKYIGNLTTLPLIPDIQSQNMTSFTVAMSGVGLTTPNGTTTNLTAPSFNASTVLDSGSTLSLLPGALARQIWQRFNIQLYQYAFIDCAYGRGANGSATFLNFQFNGATIRVPMEEMVLDNMVSVQDDLRKYIDLPEICLFGIQSAASFGLRGSDFALLGDTFLRSAYVVYDLQGLKVGIAPANLNSSRSNVVALQRADAALPALTGVRSQETSAPTATNTASGGSGGGGGGGAGQAATVTAGSGSSTTPTNAAVRLVPGSRGGSLGVFALPALFIMLGAGLFVL
jgi:hypothetical protein